MQNTLSDLNQQNNNSTIDIDQVKNQVKDQVKEALIQNKKKRGGKKHKKKKDKNLIQTSNNETSMKEAENNINSGNDSISMANNEFKHEKTKHSDTKIETNQVNEIKNFN